MISAMETNVEQPKLFKLSGRLDADMVQREGSDTRERILGIDADVLLNLAEVSFVDSTGLGFLVSLRKELMARGRKLSLCGANSKVRLLLELTRMHQIFDIYDIAEASAEEQKNEF